MPDQVALQPADIPVALRIAEAPQRTFAELGADLALSASQAHECVRRLEASRLLRRDSRNSRAINRHALAEFLELGAPYAFPAQFGTPASGVPTAWSGPELANDVDADDEPVVWPSTTGTSWGRTMTPLYPNAVKLPETCPSVYRALTLVDALRGGNTRERKLASTRLRIWLGLHRSHVQKTA